MQRFAPHLIAALAALVYASNAAAGGLTEALAHPVWGPALIAEAASVASDAPARRAAEAATQGALRGLSGWAQLRPGIAWRSRDPEPAAALTASAGVAWRYDAVAITSARLDAHRGDVAAHERSLRAVRGVTSAYLALRRALIARDLAEAALPNRRLALARAEAAHLDGRAPRHQVDAAQLEMERAEAALERASRDLAAACRDAERLGIDGDAAERHHHAVLAPEPLEGWRLEAPPLDTPHETLLRRSLERDLAAARLERRGAWSVLDDVRVEASLVEQGARLRAGAALDQGRPHAWADVAYTGARDAWSVGVSARLRIDDGWHAEFERAERALLEAEAALARSHAEAAWEASEAQRALADAERDVAFAERALAVGRAALRDLAAELGDAREDLRTLRRSAPDDAAAVAAAEARVARFDDAYRRALLGHQRERDAFMRTWERYLREAERLWAGTGWPFGALPGASVGE